MGRLPEAEAWLKASSFLPRVILRFRCAFVFSRLVLGVVFACTQTACGRCARVWVCPSVRIVRIHACAAAVGGVGSAHCIASPGSASGMSGQEEASSRAFCLSPRQPVPPLCPPHTHHQASGRPASRALAARERPHAGLGRVAGGRGRGHGWLAVMRARSEEHRGLLRPSSMVTRAAPWGARAAGGRAGRRPRPGAWTAGAAAVGPDCGSRGCRLPGFGACFESRDLRRGVAWNGAWKGRMRRPPSWIGLVGNQGARAWRAAPAVMGGGGGPPDVVAAGPLLFRGPRSPLS